jgi:glycosyltransferase involved in cell wall biosynthesis
VHGFLASRAAGIPFVLSLFSSSLPRSVSHLARPMAAHAARLTLEGTGLTRSYPWLRRHLHKSHVVGAPMQPPRVVAPSDRRGARQRLGLPQAATVVGTVGNFGPQKGHEDLVPLARRLLEQDPDVRLAVLGQPLPAHRDHQQAVARAVRAAGLEDRIVFQSPTEPAMALLPAFDVFVLTSRYEGVPAAVLEALSWGLPVVSYDVGSVRDVVRHDWSGLLVPERQPDALGKQVLRVISDRHLRDRFAVNAREVAAGLTPALVAGRYAEALTRARQAGGG